MACASPACSNCTSIACAYGCSGSSSCGGCTNSCHEYCNNDCSVTCSGSCNGCEGTCKDSCSSTCTGDCTGTSTGKCGNTCTGACNYGCSKVANVNAYNALASLSDFILASEMNNAQALFTRAAALKGLSVTSVSFTTGKLADDTAINTLNSNGNKVGHNPGVTATAGNLINKTQRNSIVAKARAAYEEIVPI